jgi:plasmid stabilization system protein ParE
MKYHVIWQPHAKDQLATIWNAAHDRRTVTAAADELDRLLADDSLDLGESRAGNDRIAFVPPLGATFRVDERRRTVRVGRVWLC